jgi:type IV secretory pathway TrbD component
MSVQKLSVALAFVAAALFFWLAFSGPEQRPVYSALGVVFLILGVARARRAARRGPPST